MEALRKMKLLIIALSMLAFALITAVASSGNKDEHKAYEKWKKRRKTSD